VSHALPQVSNLREGKDEGNAMMQPARIGALLALVWLGASATAAEPKGADPVDQAFEQLKSYDYGQSRRPLAVLELYVGRLATDPERKSQVAARLAAILAAPKATHAAKLFVCRQLLLVGTEEQVPLLVKMLDDPKTVDMARRTLEGIPGEASLAALRAALVRLKGRARVGVINSLGIRRDAQAVGAIAGLLRSSERQVAAAAAEALGKIGTAEAAAALLKARAPGKLLWVIHDAQLACAERLAAAGDNATAGSIYEQIWKSDRPAAWRLAGLSGLAKVSKEKAVPLVLRALDSDDPLFRTTALRLTRELPGRKVTAALVKRLAVADPKGQALLLGVLAERGDRSAAPAVLKLIGARDGSVRAAALQAMGSLGDASTIHTLAKLAAAGDGTARESLVRLSAPGVEERLLEAAAKGDPAIRLQVIRALGARRSAGATPVLLKAASDPNATIRTAAFEALVVAGQPQGYEKLIQLLVSASTPAEAQGAQNAVIAVGARLAAPAERVAPVLAALGKAPARARPALLPVLGACGGSEALKAVRAHVGHADEATREAAVRALANWQDGSAAPDLLKLAKGSEDDTHRVLALRGYLRLAGAATGAARLKMLEQVRQIATTQEAKRMLLGALGDVADPGALRVVASFLDDREVHAEAAVAMLKIGKALMATDRKAVRAAMKTLLEKSKDNAIVKQAEALHAEALKPPRRPGAANVPSYDKKRSDAMKADVAKRAPKGYHLVCYLNCGPDTRDGVKGKPTLRHVSGQAYRWGGSDIRYGTIFYTGSEVLFEARGLNPRKAYQLGFSWWDCDHDSRVQSVWASTAKGRPTRLLKATKLPSGAKGQKPAEKTLPIPRELTAGRSLRIVFRNEGSPNCVVSELWLLESEGESDPPPVPKNPNPGSAMKPKALKPGQTTRVLLVTGQDSAHNWRPTAPALAEVLSKDPRLNVRVVEDPNLLASGEVKYYDVVVMHFQNPKPLPKTVEARANLQKFVEGGKGLVVIHFACGAFQEWKGFGNLAGRAWDPKLRAHDPHGKFTVRITDVKHPVTEGMRSFETTDELYTCLAGDAPIQILAVATSKVDKKNYPMAFVLTVGKGRVFHTTLGHNVRAITNPPVAELFRRGTAWAAGLPPVPGVVY